VPHVQGGRGASETGHHVSGCADGHRSSQRLIENLQSIHFSCGPRVLPPGPVPGSCPPARVRGPGPRGVIWDPIGGCEPTSVQAVRHTGATTSTRGSFAEQWPPHDGMGASLPARRFRPEMAIVSRAAPQPSPAPSAVWRPAPPTANCSSWRRVSGPAARACPRALSAARRRQPRRFSPLASLVHYNGLRYPLRSVESGTQLLLVLRPDLARY
jgi:hypothetical protein